jgi:DNA-binding SARP family transcriptional activator
VIPDREIPVQAIEWDGNGIIMKMIMRIGCAAAGGGTMVHLHIRLFGAPAVSLVGGAAVPISSDKACALLAYLAVNAGQAQRREKLAGLLWPGFTETSARTNLRRALSDLRLAIGQPQTTPAYLLTTQETIQFNTASDAFVDVIAFSRLVKAGTPADPDIPPSAPSQTVITPLEEAVGLYQAPFLDGFSIADSTAFEEWVLLIREQYNRLMLQTLHRLADIFQKQGQYGQALPHAWRQVEMDPWQERGQRQLMQLLALGGQRAAALAQYESCRKLLATELGIEPSEQTQQLYDLLRRGAWPPATAVTSPLPTTPVGPCPYRGLAAFRREDAPIFSAVKPLCPSWSRPLTGKRPSLLSLALPVPANPRLSLPACCRGWSRMGAGASLTAGPARAPLTRWPPLLRRWRHTPARPTT